MDMLILPLIVVAFHDPDDDKSWSRIRTLKEGKKSPAKTHPSISFAFTAAMLWHCVLVTTHIGNHHTTSPFLCVSTVSIDLKFDPFSFINAKSEVHA